MIDKLLVITAYAIPTVTFLIICYFITKKALLNQELLLSLVKDGLLMSQSFLTGYENMAKKILIIKSNHT